MIHVGFTGTRFGMSHWQWRCVDTLVAMLAKVDMLTAHHGDCIGADADFHEIARSHGADIVVHPPFDEELRAHMNQGVVAWRDPLSHLSRNRAIVMESMVLIATPLESVHQPKGGTWYTVDYYRRTGKPLALVLRGRHANATIEYNGSDWPRAKS